MTAAPGLPGLDARPAPGGQGSQGPGILSLAGCEAVAAGSRRRVFVHPLDPGTIVKVDRADWARIRGGPLTRAKRRVLPSTDERDKFVEAAEAMRVALRRQGTGLRMPVPAFRGFANTDLGLGTLHERIRDASGGTAPPLSAWPRDARGALDEETLAAVADLMRRVIALNLVVSDLHPGNIAVGHDGDGLYCTLVDGFGDRAMIRLRTMSPRLNAWKLHRRIAALAAGIGATWDPATRRLRVPGPA